MRQKYYSLMHKIKYQLRVYLIEYKPNNVCYGLLISHNGIFLSLYFISVIKSSPKEQFGMSNTHFWRDFSTYTDIPENDIEDEPEETTTHDPYPFFEDPNSTANVTTQLGSNVYLHCKVNDLRGKTVSKISDVY